MMYKKILVPVDGSPNSLRAVEAAAMLAEHFAAEVQLLHVREFSRRTPTLEQIKGLRIPANVSNDPEQYAAEVLRQARSLIGSSIEVKTIQREGSACEEIVEYLKEEACDLIVIGNRGLGTLKSLLQGSVSAYVMQEASCPVLLIK